MHTLNCVHLLRYFYLPSHFIHVFTADHSRCACTHLPYVCDWLQAASCLRSWNWDFKGEVKQSLLLFLQKNVLLNQKKEEEVVDVWVFNGTVRHSRLPDLKSRAQRLTPSAVSPVALNGWHTAVLHWQALCSYTHAKAASWRTALVSPALDDSNRSGCEEVDEGLSKTGVLYPARFEPLLFLLVLILFHCTAWYLFCVQAWLFLIELLKLCIGCIFFAPLQ